MEEKTSQVLIELASKQHSQIDYNQQTYKPIEMYLFIDPLCPECWAFEPLVKKLDAEYGHYFKLRQIITSSLTSPFQPTPYRIMKKAKLWDTTAAQTGMSCDGNYWLDHPDASPWLAILSIKAAELQGQRAGARYLRKLRESLFLDKKNVSEEQTLIDIAKQVNLDVKEFYKDLYSNAAKRALLGDLELTREMGVEKTPSIVLFNWEDEYDGLKVSEPLSYEAYVGALSEVFGEYITPQEKPELESFLAQHRFVATKEVAVVFDMPVRKAERELLKLSFKNRLKRIPAKYGSFWEYTR